MRSQTLYLIDHTSTRIAVVNVTRDEERYRGTIFLDTTPPHLLQLFAEFEESVEGQMFSIADEIEQKLAALPLRVVFDNGMEAQVSDLQVYPSTGRVSFQTRQQQPDMNGVGHP